jgi:hypothetical protein
MRDLLHLDDDDIWDLQHPMRVDDYDDPMFIPDRIHQAQMSGALPPDAAGFSLSSIVHAATAPIRTVASIAHRAAMAPLYGLEKAVNAITPGAPGGGGGGVVGGASAPAPDDPSAAAPDPGDGGGDPDMSGMHLGRHKHRRHHHAVTGFSLPDWHPLKALERINPFGNKAGELLVSAVPGGVAAKEAHSIAKKALANGTLKPAHLKKAGDLARAARSGHKGSLAKIATIKHKAGKGDPHAEVAMDRLRLADTIQRGGTIRQSTTSLRHLRQVGLATLKG